MRADLHIHSVFSDGSDFPEDIVKKAKSAGLGCIALTDHDTVKGVEVAVAQGAKSGIKVLAGVELSTYATTEVHILGYNVDYKSDAFVQKMLTLENQRTERIKNILARLSQFNISVDEQKVFDRKGIVGRMHIATELLRKGYCASITEAFDRYLGEKGVAYIPSKRMTPLEGVKLIKQAGGQAVLAHPLNYYQKKILSSLIEGLKPYGLAGLEVYYPTHSLEDTANLYEIAKGYRLFATGGTDYHGENKKGVEIGDVDYRPDSYALSRLGIAVRPKRKF